MKIKDKTGHKLKIESSISEKMDMPKESENEAIIVMLQILQGLLKLISSWTYTKDNPPKK